MARLRKKMQAAGTTGSAETSRHSPRDGLHAYTQSPWCAGLSGHHCATLAHRRVIPASGYRDAATSRPRQIVRPRPREEDAATSRGHRLPASRVVTIARNAPPQ
ncbi:MAG: hypothetical protein EKK32_20265 [Bradyrhizobiaceae bacterium]|nr:MAG: hypothetical protein EKK32_20265 [Bradyrhizobiaceae bacterium]